MQHLRLLAAAALAASLSSQSPFTVGNLVVVTVNTGAIASAVTLDEYTTTGTLVQSIPLPTLPSGTQHGLTIRGNAASEGYLNVSADGRYLVLGGYEAPVGTPGATLEAAAAATFPRVIARVDLQGNIDTSTALLDAYDGGTGTAGNFRSVASVDGSSFWTAGTGVSPSAGVRHVPNLGDSTSTFLNGSSPTNCRVVGIYDSLLYTTSASTVYLGVCSVGSGLPTTPGQQISLLPGFPTSGGTSASSTYDFFWADPNTVYVADDNVPASTVGGISKWTFNGTTWSRAYRLTVQPTPTSNWGARGLTGHTRNGVTTLWATMVTGSGTSTVLCSVTDTGPNSVVTPLLTSPAGTAFRGVRHLAKPSSILRFAASCGGSADIKIQGNAEIGTDVRTTITNPVGLPAIVYGLSGANLQISPGCSCFFGTSLDVLVFGATATLSLPNAPSLVGLAIFSQGADLLAPGGCSSPLAITVTDFFAILVQ
ncbi:MAG: hypothetical protein JNK49_20115 [Planctomycetes bacterium]|nr:hypothetical protein [Planctomycetota bacterium]